jgi:hypothetical protein
MIYIDNLTLRKSVVAFLSYLRSGRDINYLSIILLDANRSWLTRVVYIPVFQLLGFIISEEPFFAGHLHCRDGKNVILKSNRLLNHISEKISLELMGKMSALKVLKTQWPESTLALYLEKVLFNIGIRDRTILKILIAEALTKDTLAAQHTLIVGYSSPFQKQHFEKISSGFQIKYVVNKMPTEWKNNRFAILLLLILTTFKRIKFSRKATNSEKHRDSKLPGLLLLQEDDTLLDRSYRSQPYWLPNVDIGRDYNIFILQPFRRAKFDNEETSISRTNFYCSDHKELFYKQPVHSIFKEIHKVIWGLQWHLLMAPMGLTLIIIKLAQLYRAAMLIASYSVTNNIQATMTSESYLILSDAINLIAPKLKIHTFSYQYSNISDPGPLMRSSVNTMYTFSDLYKKHWGKHKLGPENYVNVGYIYDSARALVANRSSCLRQSLHESGVTFIVGHFDENIEYSSKYGIVSADDQKYEYELIAQFILCDPTVAVIIKPQFKANSTSNKSVNAPLLEEARKTGRFIELNYGNHRNNVFPVEVALASDMVISHALGATAGLEAALSGSRSVLLNPYKAYGEKIDLLESANVLYPNLKALLGAIQGYRAGEEANSDLGDWSQVIHNFDPYQDGQATVRLKNHLEKTIRLNTEK